jgi:20S proteasome subunit alpha 6
VPRPTLKNTTRVSRIVRDLLSSVPDYHADPQPTYTGSVEELITHGLHALRETLQQDKELSIKNTSIGILGPAGAHEAGVSAQGNFRILEDEKIDVYLQTMVPKETEAPSVTAPPPTAGDADVQMTDN